MGSRIDRDSWAIIERVIRRYPEQKEEYENMLLELEQSGRSARDGQPRGSSVGNPTEGAVIRKVDKLTTPRAQRMKRELAAVSEAYEELSDDHKKVIRIRFWSDRYRNVSYLHMQRSVSYSERQMKRVCIRFVKKVGKLLGEI